MCSSDSVNLGLCLCLCFAVCSPPSRPAAQVVDVSYIYGVPDGKTAYDEQSTSAIRLNNGMVLYLRQVR